MTSFRIQITRPAYGGLFIGTHEGKIVLVKGPVLPGETVEVTVDEEKKDYITASLRHIVQPSPDRVVPACKYFGTCGGCQLQHASYAFQVSLKEAILLDALKRVAKIDTDLSAPVMSADPWNYRVRGQFKASGEALGFYRASTRQVVDIDQCPLMDPQINAHLHQAKEAVRGLPVNEVQITSGDCLIALVRMRESGKRNAERRVLTDRLQRAGFSGVAIECADGRIERAGRRYVTLNLSGLDYTVSPMSFVQANWRLNRDVVTILQNELQTGKSVKILDLYAGAGNFSLPLSIGAVIVAAEENPYSVEDGRRNIRLNSKENITFIRSRAEDVKQMQTCDIVILDPPRLGLTNRALSGVILRMPERIVYVSCCPPTLARDLRKLLSTYEIESVRVVDLFPQTYHIEALVFLRKRGRI